MQLVWHGTQQEAFDLINAVVRNCICVDGLMGVKWSMCTPHQMITEDQRFLDRLLFARWMGERLRHEEFSGIKSGVEKDQSGQAATSESEANSITGFEGGRKI